MAKSPGRGAASSNARSAQIWPHPDYPLVDMQSRYDRADRIAVARSLGFDVPDQPELPVGVLLDDWQSDHFPKLRTREAFIQWCSIGIEYFLPTWAVGRKDIYGVMPWEEVHDEALRIVRDAYAIVRYCQDELGLVNPPAEPTGPEARRFTLNEARAELRRVRDWLRQANSGEGTPSSKRSDGSSEYKQNSDIRRKASGRRDYALLFAKFLIVHHQCEESGCLNWEPIGCRELARNVSPASQSTASAFFKKQFESYDKYVALCQQKSRSLPMTLAVVSGDAVRQGLANYGRNPPGEGPLEDDE